MLFIQRVTIILILFVHLNNSTEIPLLSEDIQQHDYVKWLIKNLPFRNHINELINCIDVTVIGGPGLDLNFIDILLQQLMVAISKVTIRLNYQIDIGDNHFNNLNYISCDQLMIIDLTQSKNGKSEYLMDSVALSIKKLSTLNKYKYFVVIQPVPESNPLKWPSEIFTHNHVIVVIEREIYELETPFKNGRQRTFRKLEFNEHRQQWRDVDAIMRSFNGVHLMTSTLNCDPHNYWDELIKDVPAKADICQKSHQNVGSNCSKLIP